MENFKGGIRNHIERYLVQKQASFLYDEKVAKMINTDNSFFI